MLTRFNSVVLVLFLIFVLGLWLRLISIYPANTIIGFDQIRDIFSATSIYQDHDIKIIGPTAGNNPNLHHGILFIYYLLVPLFLSHGNIMVAVFWNAVINLSTIFVIFLLGRDLFNQRVGVISALLVTVSYFFIQFAPWLSNPSPTLLTVPLFFLGLWRVYLGKKYALVITAIGLCLSVQFELFFIYLIPVGFLLWILLRIPFPKVRDLLISLSVGTFILSTMILTEIKYHFGGVLSIIGAGNYVGGVETTPVINKFLEKYFEVISLSIFPTQLELGRVVAVLIFIFLFYELQKDIKNKSLRDRYLFILIYLLSPATMLFLGFHNAPWFLIGLPGAVCLVIGFILSKIKSTVLLLTILGLIIFANIAMVYRSVGVGQRVLEPDASALYSIQVQVLDYTYREAKGEPFLINTVTNPLYINALWSYHYKYLGEKRYGYVPTWGGGIQLYPYNTLEAETGREKYIFVIMDSSFRIGEGQRDAALFWAAGKGIQIKEKKFGGWKVVQFRR